MIDPNMKVGRMCKLAQRRTAAASSHSTAAKPKPSKTQKWNRTPEQAFSRLHGRGESAIDTPYKATIALSFNSQSRNIRGWHCPAAEVGIVYDSQDDSQDDSQGANDAAKA
jgi:hypothetical protein